MPKPRVMLRYRGRLGIEWVHTKCAVWKRKSAVYNNSATVPPGATKVNVVLLYTDILEGPLQDTATVAKAGEVICQPSSRHGRAT